MYRKQILALSKLWLLLLLVGNGVTASNLRPISSHEKEADLFFKTQHSLHKDGLQPEVITLRIAPEPAVKSFGFGLAIVAEFQSQIKVGAYLGSTVLLLQDANRCESVSRLLFPHHFFW